MAGGLTSGRDLGRAIGQIPGTDEMTTNLPPLQDFGAIAEAVTPNLSHFKTFGMSSSSIDAKPGTALRRGIA